MNTVERELCLVMISVTSVSSEASSQALYETVQCQRLSGGFVAKNKIGSPLLQVNYLHLIFI